MKKLKNKDHKTKLLQYHRKQKARTLEKKKNVIYHQNFWLDPIEVEEKLKVCIYETTPAPKRLKSRALVSSPMER